MAKNIESVSSSRLIVTCQISDIQCQVQEKLNHAMNNCKYFTACLYVGLEACVTDVSQLCEDWAAENVVNEHRVFAKLSAIVIDGASKMQ